MQIKVLLTGATGFVGGDFLYALHHEEAALATQLEITALVRDEAKGQLITQAFPAVKIVVGDMKDAAFTSRLASAADIVMHLAAAANFASIEAVHHGLQQPRGSRKAFHIQVGGASFFAADEIAARATLGSAPASDKLVFDDLDGVPEIRRFVRAHPERRAENYILDETHKGSSSSSSSAEPNNDSGINTAFVVGPLIYGRGRGPVNQRSLQIPELARIALETGKVLKVGAGDNVWATVHVADLSDVFVRLLKRAVDVLSGRDGDQATAEGGAVWGPDAVYLAHVDEVKMGDVAELVAAALAAKQAKVQIAHITPDEADKLAAYGSIMWGTNVRATGRRATELLGWQPRYKDDIAEEVQRVVDEEVERIANVVATA
ncbi:uncharacterized protein B0I36DRAFT_316067 [Microdochium trichocladiopsis]|uniref:NAD-dependent epimerase/dehydratase domain-containing protein n=1 Tax=Microdochium trichocladiopsis TaxID=1682393 RepID=A0A9P8YCR5_9PEZI|nr:uncharacterized protein B0I36DRAFT_316067 [Microdochium trichocladiopsis]KAH7038371.1 hypothetical protein B0I36DRAFT_316067 [Microdochium trichocladiopsis]